MNGHSKVRYRISEIRIGPAEYADREKRAEHIRQALQRTLDRKFGKGHAVPFSDLEIIRESIDARRKPDVKAVYTLDFDCGRELPLPAGGIREYEEAFAWVYDGAPAAYRPVIAGFGPCGIFAALVLAEAGMQPLVLERGQSVAQRMQDVQRFWKEGILDPESNVQFGEGGAGTFSDGKLTTGIKDIRIRKVLKEFTAAGADPAILYQQRPHIGTDKLREIIPAIRRRIEDLGGEVRFGTKLVGLETADGKLTAVLVEKRHRDGANGRAEDAVNGRTEDAENGRTRAGANHAPDRIPATDLILAIGHSARDTFRMLRELPSPLAMEQKPFSIGVRIEHPQERIDAAQYGDPALAEVFGPAIYKLHHRCENGRGVYTFCMCPGGRVINAASEPESAVTNGMSESGRDSGIANSGLLVDVRTSDFGSDDPLAGVEFQRHYERLAWVQAQQASARRAPDPMLAAAEGVVPAADPAGRSATGLPQTTYGQFRASQQNPVRQSMPAFAGEAILEAMPHLGRKLAGFDADDAVMTAVETRSSSPVRILRDKEMQSGIRGVVPAGEGPGYAGGIMSAAVDGIKAAEQIIRRCRERTEET